MQGADDWVSAGEAAPAWAAHRFWPHVLRDVTEVDPGVTLLGVRSALPFGVAPDLAAARGPPRGRGGAWPGPAPRPGSLMVVSSNAGTPFAEIGATGVRWWLQVYLPADRTSPLPLLRARPRPRARTRSCSPWTPRWWRTKYARVGPLRVGRRRPGDGPRQLRPGLRRVTPGSEKAPDLGPHDVAWLAAEPGCPSWSRGCCGPTTPAAACDAGAAAVWVSNHGGRQLDRAVATATALPLVAEAVGERAEVYVDGGIRSGLDVLAALARGARAAFLGRPPALALVDGEPGVTRLLSRLGEEMVEALRLAGCRGVGDARGTAAPGPENTL